MTLTDKLDALMKSRGLNKRTFSLESGIPYSTINSIYVRGYERTGLTTLRQICDFFGVTLDYLARDEIEDPAYTGEEDVYQLPVIGRVAAGMPVLAVENVVGHIPYDKPVTGLFALNIKGDSMSPRILDGDKVVVKQQAAADDGDVVIALIGDDATCKVLKKSSWGITLVPFNAAFPPLVFAGEEANEVKIIGKVVESIHKWS